MSELYTPTRGVIVPNIVARGVTEAGRETAFGEAVLEVDEFIKRALRDNLLGGGASFSDYLELKVLDHIFNDGTFSVPSTVALALCTTTPTDASIGSTLVEAGYTGYARKAIAAADMSAAASGSKTNSAAITFDACTASSSTVQSWATADSATTAAGNVLVWGTATSTVISTTQTPATVAIGGLVVNLD